MPKVIVEPGRIRALDDAWRLDLLGQRAWIGDLSEQVAYKLYMATADDPGPELWVNKDLEDGLHIARVAKDAIDRARVRQRVSILGVPTGKWEAFCERAGWV